MTAPAGMLCLSLRVKIGEWRYEILENVLIGVLSRLLNCNLAVTFLRSEATLALPLGELAAPLGAD